MPHDIEALRAKIEALRNQLDRFELDPDNYTDQYDEALNETNDTVQVGNLSWSPAKVLKEMDPIAYRCGLNDYVDCLDVEDDADYQALKEELTDLEAELETMEGGAQ